MTPGEGAPSQQEESLKVLAFLQKRVFLLDRFLLCGTLLKHFGPKRGSPLKPDNFTFSGWAFCFQENRIMAASKGIAFRQGRYLPVEEASIAILDPAFTKSDVVFDVVSVWDGHFFRLQDHMRRFRESCTYVHMSPPYREEEMKGILAQCVDRAGLSEALVYFLCTRGRYAGGAAFGDPRTCRNEFIAYSVPYYWVVARDRVENGAHLWIPETRRAPDAAINQRVKNFNRMDLTRAQHEALEQAADAPLLLSTEGYLTEGPGFNVWIVADGKARTPAGNLLEGITRLTVFDLCREIGVDAKACDLDSDDLQGADEVFISSSGGGLVPVTTVNKAPIGDGTPGFLTCQLRDLYWEKRSQGWHSTPVAKLIGAAKPLVV